MAFVNQAVASIADFLDKRVVLQMDNKIYLNRANRNALLAFMARMGQTKTYRNMEFHYLTKKVRPPYLPLASVWAVNAPTIFDFAAGEGVWFEPGTTFFMAGVQFKTTSVTAGGGVGATDRIVASMWPAATAQALPAEQAIGVNVMLSYAVFGEKADAPVGNYVDTVDNFNYMEQFMRAVNLTQLMLRTQVYGGEDVRAMEHRLALEAWKTDIETKMLLSVITKDASAQATPTIGTIWNMAGLAPFITQKVKDFSAGAFDIDTLLAEIPGFMEYADPQDWALLVNSDFLMQLQLAAQDKLWYDTKDDSFGYAVRKWNTSFASFPLVHMRMLDYWPENTALFVNMKELYKTNLEGVEAEPRLYLNAQLPSQPNKVWDFYRGVMGIQLGQDQMHAKVVDWT